MATITFSAAEAEAPAVASDAAAPTPAKSPKPPKSEVSELVKQAQAYVEPLLQKNLDPRLTYHTLAHTAYVVKQAHALADDAKLSAKEIEELLVAAWFHDSGYLDTYDGHEYKSMTRAAEWLQAQGYDPAGIEVVKNLIRVTHRNEDAKTELEKIISDADMSNLAADDYRSRWCSISRIRTRSGPSCNSTSCWPTSTSRK
jgi:predicted metal-dependent HD superfamily phosphohydrolase